jgi:hypothetical protein
MRELASYATVAGMLMIASILLGRTTNRIGVPALLAFSRTGNDGWRARNRPNRIRRLSLVFQPGHACPCLHPLRWRLEHTSQARARGDRARRGTRHCRRRAHSRPDRDWSAFVPVFMDSGAVARRDPVVDGRCCSFSDYSKRRHSTEEFKTQWTESSLRRWSFSNPGEYRQERSMRDPFDQRPTARDLGRDFYECKAKYGGLEVSEARRLKSVEDENCRLKKLLAESMLDNAALKDLLGKGV